MGNEQGIKEHRSQEKLSKLPLGSHKSLKDRRSPFAKTMSIDWSICQPNECLLMDFRGQLNFKECLYVFRSLLQQCCQRLHKHKKLRVAGELCVVSSLGEVRLSKKSSKNCYQQLAYSLVSVVSRLNSILDELSDGQSPCQYSYFQNKMAEAVYQAHQNETRMYQRLLDEVSGIMERQNIKANLLPAYLRLKAQNSRLLSPRDINAGMSNRSEEVSQSFSSRTPSMMSKKSHHKPFYKTHTTHPTDTMLYQPHYRTAQWSSYQQPNSQRALKMMESVSQQDFDNEKGHHFEQSQSFVYPNPPPSAQESMQDFFSETRHHGQLRIASQFCFNMYCEKPSPRVKFRKQSKQAQRSSQLIEPKYTTSLNGIDQVKEVRGKISAKSVLELMARSVEVRAQPSSQSQIS